MTEWIAISLITIVDRARLEERSCECYRIIRDEYARLLPPRQSPRTSVD